MASSSCSIEVITTLPGGSKVLFEYSKNAEIEYTISCTLAYNFTCFSSSYKHISVRKLTSVCGKYLRRSEGTCTLFIHCSNLERVCCTWIQWAQPMGTFVACENWRKVRLISIPPLSVSRSLNVAGGPIWLYLRECFHETTAKVLPIKRMVSFFGGDGSEKVGKIGHKNSHSKTHCMVIKFLHVWTCIFF